MLAVKRSKIASWDVMEKTVIPFSPFPLHTLRALSSSFAGIGARIADAMPYLKIELRQAEIDLDAVEYGAVMFFMLVFYFIIGSIIFGLIAYRLVPDKVLVVAPTAGAFLGLMVFVQVSMFPKIKLKRKVRNIEKNLIFALRKMLVQLKSGISLFDAMSAVAYGDYGGVSREFRKAVDEINTGTMEEDALQELAMNNPSLFFRRAVWQIVNGLKAGAGVGTVMKALVENITKEETIEIRRYGSSLRLLSLVYMMIGVIIPALGLAFLIILGSFPQMRIGEWLFWLMLFALLIAQFMYIGMLKSKRPALIGG